MYRYRCVDLEIYHILPRIRDWSYHLGLFPQKNTVGFSFPPPFSDSPHKQTYTTRQHTKSFMYTQSLSRKKNQPISFFLSPSHFLSVHTHAWTERERHTHTHTHTHTQTHTHTETNTNTHEKEPTFMMYWIVAYTPRTLLHYAATRCNTRCRTLQVTATHCNTNCNTLQLNTTRCNTHCNIL